MNGKPSIIMTPAENAKQNLNNVNSNKFICNQNDQKIEKFENYNIEKKSNKNNAIIYLFIILFLLLIFLFIYKKRIFK
jgi:flagellar biosynthesis/type III secretory pathway M-ring protein FliF/YscJ